MSQHTELYVKTIKSPDSDLRAIYCTSSLNNTDIFGSCSLIPFEHSELAVKQAKQLALRSKEISEVFDLKESGAHLTIFGLETDILDQSLVPNFYKFLSTSFGWNFSSSIEDKIVSFSSRKPSVQVDLSMHCVLGIFSLIKLYQKRHEIRLDNMKVAIQGLGRVGMKLAELCNEEGYQLFTSDVNQRKCAEAEKSYRVSSVDINEIYNQECVVFCPCAIGAVYNDLTRSMLNCELVIGSAQHQFSTDSLYKVLNEKSPIWIPDFLFDPSILSYYHNDMDEYIERLKKNVLSRF
jgi:hypothetical protein